MTDHKVNGKYILVGIAAVIFTWLLHEFSHWSTYTFFGYDYMMMLNKVSFISGEKPTDVHQIMAGSAGPLITILQAVSVYLFLKFKGWNKYLYLFLFTPFYMRFLAGLLNFINPNDEGAIGQYFGIGLFTISIIVSILLFYMVFQISKKYALTRKFQLLTYLIVMVASSILILSDQYFEIRIL